MAVAPGPQRFFYGWVIVTAACVIVGMGMGLMLALGVFLEPFETTFGWGRGAIGQGILVGVPVATEQKTALGAREPLRPCVARPVRRDVVSE